MATTVGQLTIEPLIDGTLYGDPTNLFGRTPNIDLGRHADLLTPTGGWKSPWEGSWYVGMIGR